MLYFWFVKGFCYPLNPFISMLLHLVTLIELFKPFQDYELGIVIVR